MLTFVCLEYFCWVLGVAFDLFVCLLIFYVLLFLAFSWLCITISELLCRTGSRRILRINLVRINPDLGSELCKNLVVFGPTLDTNISLFLLQKFQISSNNSTNPFVFLIKKLFSRIVKKGFSIFFSNLILYTSIIYMHHILFQHLHFLKKYTNPPPLPPFLSMALF